VRAKSDLEVQRVDIGQSDEPPRRSQVAQIERRVSARVPGQKVEALLSRLLDDGAIGWDLDNR
jgi:hypothetical protein